MTQEHVEERRFAGFSRKAFRFLKDLKANNDKRWFDKQDIFELEGETYKRHKGPDKPEPLRTWYNYKSFYLSCNRKIDNAILTAQLTDDLMHGFGMTAPLYRYMLDTLRRAKQPT